MMLCVGVRCNGGVSMSLCWWKKVGVYNVFFVNLLKINDLIFKKSGCLEKVWKECL